MFGLDTVPLTPEEEATLSPCPRCGKKPRLYELIQYQGGKHPTLFYFHFECRRLWGLRRCHASPPHVIEKDWGDLGRRMAVAKWNDSLESVPRRS